MNSDQIKQLQQIAESLTEPEDLFRGKCLAPDFALPDNILTFYHDFTAPIPNSHGRHTLVFPLDSMTYFVERNRIELQPGLMLYVPPYAVRFLHPDSPGYRRLFITFDTKGKQRYLPKLGVYELSGGELLYQFFEEYHAGRTEQASVGLMNFLSMQKSIFAPALSESEVPENLTAVISMIETRISEVYGIKSLSDAIGKSESHLRSVFRRYMGVSIGRFIIEKKMDYAKYCLLNSEKSIAEIARGCGFANVFVFSCFFKRNAGMPPLHFRKNQQSRKEK